jgi:hypothetical protein
MTDVIEVSYTGDLLAHRRCGRAWAYEKHAGFHPYEVVQAMEGRLIHHAMEWLTRQYQDTYQRRRHAHAAELRAHLEHYFRVLWARGIRTAFVSKRETLDRVMENLYPGGVIDPIVQTVVEGAQHTEYELRAVKKVLPADFGGKSRILLTGILDLVIQQQAPLTYQRVWEWDSLDDLTGHPKAANLAAVSGDVEIWDYKGTRATTGYIEKKADHRLLAVRVDDKLVRAAVDWTEKQVRELQETRLAFERDPLAVTAGEFVRRSRPLGQRLTSESTQQCTACSFRFGCEEYEAYLGGGPNHPDIDVLNVAKN